MGCRETYCRLVTRIAREEGVNLTCVTAQSSWTSTIPSNLAPGQYVSLPLGLVPGVRMGLTKHPQLLRNEM